MFFCPHESEQVMNSFRNGAQLGANGPMHSRARVVPNNFNESLVLNGLHGICSVASSSRNEGMNCSCFVNSLRNGPMQNQLSPLAP